MYMFVYVIEEHTCMLEMTVKEYIYLVVFFLFSYMFTIVKHF